MNHTSVWIAGAGGQLGRALTALLQQELGAEVFMSDVEDVDIADMHAVSTFVDMNRPNCIVNCAGMTNLDVCEQNVERAYAVNALGARNLGIAARKVNAKIIHISTDDVFDGRIKRPLNEFDPAEPQSVYGKSKLAGEILVRELAAKHMIVRSSWIYGDSPNNFVHRVLEAARSGELLKIPEDQISTPTSAKDLARFVVSLLESEEYGIYHASCEGFCTRYEFAEEICRLAGIPANLIPVCTGEADVESERPCYTLLDNFMLRVSGIYEMPLWQDSLREFLTETGVCTR